MCTVAINPQSKQVTFDGLPTVDHLSAREQTAIGQSKRLVRSESGAWFVMRGCDWRKAAAELNGALRS